MGTRTALAWKYHSEGLSNADIGRKMGISPGGVSTLLRHAREYAHGRRPGADVHIGRVTRCRCGLALPCYQCLPTIWQLASGRSGDATGLT